MLTRYVLKAILSKKRALAAVIVCSLTLSYFVLLLSVSMVYRFSGFNGICVATVYSPELSTEQINEELKSLNKAQYSSIELYNSAGIGVIYLGEVWLMSGKLPASEHEVLASDTIAELGDTLEIEGVQYVVSGITARDGVYFAKEYVHELGQVDAIEFYLKNLNKIEDKAIELGSQFKGAEVGVFNDRETIFKAVFSDPIFLIVGVVTLLAFFSVLFSIRYLIEEARKVFEVLKFCGAQATQIVDVLFVIAGIMLGVVFVAGGLLFAAVDAAFLNGTYAFMGIRYRLMFTDYAVIAGIITAVTAFMTAPVIYTAANTKVRVKAND